MFWSVGEFQWNFEGNSAKLKRLFSPGVWKQWTTVIEIVQKKLKQVRIKFSKWTAWTTCIFLWMVGTFTVEFISPLCCLSINHCFWCTFLRGKTGKNKMLKEYTTTEFWLFEVRMFYIYLSKMTFLSNILAWWKCNI